MLQDETFQYKGATWQRTMARPFECWVMGVDPGGVADYTAIAALHYTVEPMDDFIVMPGRASNTQGALRQRVKRTFRVRGLTRLPLGLTQPLQADELQAIRSARPQLRGSDLVFDATGLGAGLADVCQERGMHPLHRVIFSGGDEVNRLKQSRLSVPKVQLVGALDGAVQNGELEVAAGVAGADLLIKEAESFKRAITAAGRSQMNAREGAHDDLICALALCCWWAKHRQQNHVRVGTVKGTL
jgi:hypothetical protein